jgi:predicted Zn finger-like uncharacterized protein
VVVICPKCKTKLKVDDARLSPSGTRFKCPKCTAVLVVKKPVPSAAAKKTLDTTKVLIAHSIPEVLQSARAVLNDQGYKVITATDGIEVMVKTLKELPFLAVVEVSLPKIYGFELCKKLKSREETKAMKFILIASIFDKSRYRREPVSLYGADDYIEAQDIPAMLTEKINKLAVMPEEGADHPQSDQKGTAGIEPDVRQPVAPVETKPSEGKNDEATEKAKRLSRTIINDIYLYNAAKVMESIKNGNFYSMFASELNEGQKLYKNRIPQGIRDKANYFKETIEDFISKKKQELG